MKTTFNRIETPTGSILGLAVTLVVLVTGLSGLLFEEWYLKLAGVVSAALLFSLVRTLINSDWRCEQITLEGNVMLIRMKRGVVKEYRIPDEIRNISVLDESKHWIRVELAGRDGKFSLSSIHFDEPAQLDAQLREKVGT